MANFSKGDNVVMIDFFGKVIQAGVIDRLRDDAYERKTSWPNGKYYYSVTFVNGKFDTYIEQSHLRHEVENVEKVEKKEKEEKVEKEKLLQVGAYVKTVGPYWIQYSYEDTGIIIEIEDCKCEKKNCPTIHVKFNNNHDSLWVHSNDIALL